MESGIYYASGDELEGVYWQHATGMKFHGGHSVATKWSLEQVLAELGGITLSPLFVRKGKKSDGLSSYVAEMEAPQGRALLKLIHYGERNTVFGHVSAVRETELDWFLDKVFSGIVEYEKVPENADGVFMHFTLLGEYGPDTITREISAPTWDEIQQNYAESVRGKLADIINSHPKDLPGKVGIIHGPPRTGKTYWLRSLARAWADTAHITYIVDSAEFFRDSSYMMKVLLSRHDSPRIPVPYEDPPSPGETWQVLIFEDAEEFITSSAKATVGPALSKLLNLGDGLLGQGLNILFLFTTNVTVDKLHDALTGPGRCFATIEVPPLPQEHAARWLRSHGSSVRASGDTPVGALYSVLHRGVHEPAAYDITAPYL